MQAKDIKPGMVINILGANGQDCHELVVAVSNGGDMGLSHYAFQDAYGGQMTRYINRNEEVHEIITGEKRKYIIEHILKDLYKNKHDIENDIDMVNLVQAMDSQ